MSTPLRQIPVLDSVMAYREEGAEKPIALFLHGNPTSSYIWRNIIPLVSPVARCIAPDLIGFGASGKPDIAYRFADHVRYLDAFLDAMRITSAYIVAQDWGSALAFHLAARRPECVRGLAVMEYMRPVARWEDFLQDPQEREVFRKFRTRGEGERMILDDNLFIEAVLPAATARTLTDDEMAAYRAPFPTPASRLPVWRFPNELPIAGEPADVYATMETAHAALRNADYPKLLFAGNPGALISPAEAKRFAGELKSCRFIQLETGKHYLQEDHPQEIGKALSDWIGECEAATAEFRPYTFRR